MDTTFSVPSPTGTHVGLDLAVAAAEAAFDSEHARHAEAPDVGVEHADGEPAGRERGGEVHGDRRLADAALAARHREHPRGGRHLGRAACSRALKRARCIAADFCSWVISPYSTLTVATPGRPRTFDSTSWRIWTRSGHPAVVSATFTTTRAVGVDAHVVDHAQVDDARVQLGVDHPGQHAADVVGRRRGARHGLVDGRARVVGVRGSCHG